MTSPSATNYDQPQPILVKIAETPGQEKRPKELRSAHRTFVLTATNPYAQIAGYDPARVDIRMNVMDNAIVLSNSISAANDTANEGGGTIPTPNGRLMPIGIDYVIQGTNEQWISTNTYPTRVGVTILREI